jgi:hypothetical protein
MAYARFVSSPFGRALRIVLGVILIVAGLSRRDALSLVLTIIGLLPLVGGMLNVCVLCPLFGAPLSGAGLRHRV